MKNNGSRETAGSKALVCRISSTTSLEILRQLQDRSESVVVVSSADASLEQIAQACQNFLELAIRAQLQDWFWSYLHWRYKLANAGRDYPFYAQFNSEFDRLFKQQTAVEPSALSGPQQVGVNGA